MRLILYKISKEKFNSHKNRIDEESFEYIEDDFKLVLYASYFNEESSTMNKFLKDASDLNKKYNLNIFEYNVKYEKEIAGFGFVSNWNAMNFRKEFGAKNKEIKKVYISGTIGFLESMDNEFKKSEICSEDRIICI